MKTNIGILILIYFSKQIILVLKFLKINIITLSFYREYEKSHSNLVNIQKDVSELREKFQTKAIKSNELERSYQELKYIESNVSNCKYQVFSLAKSLIKISVEILENKTKSEICE